MATNGMTINGLNPLSALTADDKIPVWDTGASGEPTKEITAQNMANSVKSLASLPNTTEMNNAIAQSTAYTLIGENAGNVEITLPTGWTEMIVQVVYSSTYITTYFLSNMFHKSNKTEVSLGGYGTSYVIGRISKSAMIVTNVNWGGTNVTSQAYEYVYCR